MSGLSFGMTRVPLHLARLAGAPTRPDPAQRSGPAQWSDPAQRRDQAQRCDRLPAVRPQATAEPASSVEAVDQMPGLRPRRIGRLIRRMLGHLVLAR